MEICWFLLSVSEIKPLLTCLHKLYISMWESVLNHEGFRQLFVVGLTRHKYGLNNMTSLIGCLTKKIWPLIIMCSVLNIGRVGWDIDRYLIFCLPPIQYRESFAVSFATKNGRYLKYRPIARYWAINRPRYCPIWKNLFIARLHANVHCFFYHLCMHITSFIFGRWYLWH